MVFTNRRPGTDDPIKIPSILGDQGAPVAGGSAQEVFIPKHGKSGVGSGR